MDSAETAQHQTLAGGEVDALGPLVVTATQRLLGDTISVTDEEWRAPSRLSGWTRGHVATHVARQADALVRLVAGARAGVPTPMYATPEQRDAEIEAGAGRTGLELQIDLDTSAGALSELFDAVQQEAVWEQTVQLRHGDQAPVRMLPLARLCEVVLHHIDLDIGLDLADLDQPTADWLLQWVSFRLGQRAGFPRVRVVTDSGAALDMGSDGEATAVRGGSAELLGWLTGRGSGASLQGDDGLTLPSF